MKNLITRSGRQSADLLILAIIAGSVLSACGGGSSRGDSTVGNAASTPVSSAGSGGGSDNKNGEQAAVDAEKDKLRKEREQLEKEKQTLKDDKAKTEKLKDAVPPASEITNTVSTVNPPSNIRDSPNGKILCTVKKQATLVKLYGSTEISDNNGEWFYTKQCGKMGVIHSTQFVSPG